MLAISHPQSHLRKKPIQARSRRTVESILEAADRVLRREGYEAASTNRIAQVAGYSVGSLYQYFADKESVVRTLIDQHLVREDQRVADCVHQQKGRSLPTALESVLGFLLQGRSADAHIYTTLAEQADWLYGEPALMRILGRQSAFPSALAQLAVEHWDELRRDDLAASLWVMMAATQAVTFELAARPQPDVSLSSLLAPVREAWSRALQAPRAEHALADAVARIWQHRTVPAEALAAPHRLAELRALLLGSVTRNDPRRLAPAGFALACLSALNAAPAGARPGVDDLALDRELRVFASALLEACRGPLPGAS